MKLTLQLFTSCSIQQCWKVGFNGRGLSNGWSLHKWTNGIRWKWAGSYSVGKARPSLLSPLCRFACCFHLPDLKRRITKAHLFPPHTRYKSPTLRYSVTATENKLKLRACTLLTCHDPLGFIWLHVASTLALSCFALEVVLSIKGIRVVIRYGHLQGGTECEAIFGFVSPLCTAR